MCDMSYIEYTNKKKLSIIRLESPQCDLPPCLSGDNVRDAKRRLTPCKSGDDVRDFNCRLTPCLNAGLLRCFYCQFTPSLHPLHQILRRFFRLSFLHVQ